MFKTNFFIEFLLSKIQCLYYKDFDKMKYDFKGHFYVMKVKGKFYYTFHVENII